MNVIFKAGCINDIFNESYRNFSQKCLEGTSSIGAVRDDFYMVKDLFVKSGQVQDFFDKTSQLCEKVEAKGHQNISDLLINELSKLCRGFVLKGNNEKIIYKAIENCQRNHDGLHELARINDLEEIYRNANRRYDLLKILAKKKSCCKKILKDYDENVKNFKTIIKPPASREKVKIQLGTTYSQMADLLSYSRPKDAIALYQKAIEIHRELKFYRAAGYAAHRINEIKKGRNYGKF